MPKQTGWKFFLMHRSIPGELKSKEQENNLTRIKGKIINVMFQNYFLLTNPNRSLLIGLASVLSEVFVLWKELSLK